MPGRRIRKTGLGLTTVVFCMLLGPAPVARLEVHAQPRRDMMMTRQDTRDPFAFPPGVYPLSRTGRVFSTGGTSVKPEIKTADQSRKLTAILISDHARLASIDRRILGVGDSLYGEKILEIQKDRVILEKGGTRRTLLLSENTFALKVDENEENTDEAK